MTDSTAARGPGPAQLRRLSPADLFTASGAMLRVIVALGAVLKPVKEIRDGVKAA